MRILVAIASYGTGNDRYLARLIQEYRSMPFEVEVVVLSNLAKDLGEGAQLRVGLPTRNPWSLPFGHKQLFADRADDFDLFIFSEDDVLITEQNLHAFLKVSDVLNDEEIAGFIRIEKDAEGNTNFPEMHAHFHWDPASVKSAGEYTLAFFSNEHAGCYVMTRGQLKRAIASGGFLVGVHEWKYDLICSAGTDPYTQCGFRKVIPISHIDDFTVVHLSAKYVGKLGVTKAVLQKQLNALMQLAGAPVGAASSFPTETKLRYGMYSKSYYEPFDHVLAAAIPRGAASVLSIGCGIGHTESRLAQEGCRVAAVPLDGVIGACAAAPGVEMLDADLARARAQLGSRKFDCILYANVLHLMPDPVEAIAMFAEAVATDGVVLAKSPNMLSLQGLARLFRHANNVRRLLRYETAGTHLASIGNLRAWYRKAGLTIDSVVECSPPAIGGHIRIALPVGRSLLAPEFVLAGRRKSQ